MNIKRHKKYRQAIERIVEDQLFGEHYYLGKPQSGEEFQRRVQYFTNRIFSGNIQRRANDGSPIR